jgi:hypothetical protein
LVLQAASGADGACGTLKNNEKETVMNRENKTFSNVTRRDAMKGGIGAASVAALGTGAAIPIAMSTVSVITAADTAQAQQDVPRPSSRFDALANLPFEHNRPTEETAQTLRNELLLAGKAGSYAARRLRHPNRALGWTNGL